MPVPVPAHAGEQPASQSGSFADAPLSLSPGTLRIASLSLVTPPSELVTRDMLGAAAEGSAVPRADPSAAGVSGGRSDPADGARGTTSDMLRAVAKAAALSPALSHPQPASHAAAAADTTASSTVAATLESSAVLPGDEGATAGVIRQRLAGRVVAAGDQRPLLTGQGGNQNRPVGSDAAKVFELGPASHTVDAGLLTSFMQAGPRFSLEKVTATACVAGCTVVRMTWAPASPCITQGLPVVQEASMALTVNGA